MNKTFTECKSCHALNKVSTDKASTAVCGKCGSRLHLHGLVSEVTSHSLKKIIAKAETSVVVDFWASWCGPCKIYGPEFEKASNLRPDLVFLKINTETEQQISAELGIRGIPCTIVFRNGKELKRQAGAMSSDQLKDFLSLN